MSQDFAWRIVLIWKDVHASTFTLSVNLLSRFIEAVHSLVYFGPDDCPPGHRIRKGQVKYIQCILRTGRVFVGEPAGPVRLCIFVTFRYSLNEDVRSNAVVRWFASHTDALTSLSIRESAKQRRESKLSDCRLQRPERRISVTLVKHSFFYVTPVSGQVDTTTHRTWID